MGSQAPWPNYMIQSVCIHTPIKFKYLGVVFGENLYWEEHIKRAHSEACSRLYLFRQTRSSLDIEQSKNS